MNKFISKYKAELLWALIVCLHIFLILNIVFFPYPELFVYPYLTKIGLVPYKQIFDQHFPGLMFFPINFATLGITTPQSFRVVQVLLIILSHVGLYKIATYQNKQKKVTLVVAFLYLVWQAYFEGGTVWIESLLVPLLLFTYYFLVRALNEKNKKYLFVSGLLLGIGMITKQIVIPLSCVLGIYLLFRLQDKKQLVYWVIGAGIPLLVLFCFVYAKGIEQPFLYWGGTFNFTAYHDMGRKFPTIREIVSTLFITIPAIAGICALLNEKRHRYEGVLLGIFFSTGFLYAYARFDYIHLQPVVPFALLLFVFGAKTQKLRYVLVSLFVIFSLIVSVRFFVRNWGREVKFFGSEDYMVFNRVEHYAPKGSSIFAFGTYPYIYPLTETHPAGNVFVFQFPWFMKVAEEPILKGLILDPPLVVVRDLTATTDNYNLIEHMPKIAGYVDRYYVTREKIGTTEIMTKR